MFPRLPFQNGGGTQADDTATDYNADDNVDVDNTDSSTINLLNEPTDWWANAIEDDSFYSPMTFDAGENGLWNGRFVPPPPRPPFLDESVSSDGLTTCDLCSWAWHDRNSYSSLGDSIGKFNKSFSTFLFLNFKRIQIDLIHFIRLNF